MAFVITGGSATLSLVATALKCSLIASAISSGLVNEAPLSDQVGIIVFG